MRWYPFPCVSACCSDFVMSTPPSSCVSCCCVFAQTRIWNKSVIGWLVALSHGGVLQASIGRGVCGWRAVFRHSVIARHASISERCARTWHSSRATPSLPVLSQQDKFYVLKNVAVLAAYRSPDDRSPQSVHVMNDYACRIIAGSLRVQPKASRLLGLSAAAAVEPSGFGACGLLVPATCTPSCSLCVT